MLLGGAPLNETASPELAGLSGRKGVLPLPEQDGSGDLPLFVVIRCPEQRHHVATTLDALTSPDTGVFSSTGYEHGTHHASSSHHDKTLDI